MSRKHLIKVLFHISTILVTFTLLFLHPGMATAGASSEEEERQKSTLIDYMVLQSAGYLGYIAVGVGKDFGRHKINFMIGYVPENVGGIEIWQLDLKYDWHPFDEIPFGSQGENSTIDPFYIGLSMIYSPDDDLFVEQPTQYPSGYYSPTALRYVLNFGAALKYGRNTFFVEYNVLDVAVVAYVKHTKHFIDNYDYLGLGEIGTLAFGVKYDFD